MRSFAGFVSIILVATACGAGPETTESTNDVGPVTNSMFPTETDRRGQHAATENTIAGCMIDNGFEYSPEPWEDIDPRPTLAESQTREHREQWGLVDGPPDTDDGTLRRTKNTEIYE